MGAEQMFKASLAPVSKSIGSQAGLQPAVESIEGLGAGNRAGAVIVTAGVVSLRRPSALRGECRQRTVQ